VPGAGCRVLGAYWFIYAIERLRQSGRGEAFAYARRTRKDEAGRKRAVGNRTREQADEPTIADDVSEGHGEALNGIVSR